MTEEIAAALTTPPAEEVELAMAQTGIRDVPALLHWMLDQFRKLNVFESRAHEVAARAVINEASRPAAADAELFPGESFRGEPPGQETAGGTSPST